MESLTQIMTTRLTENQEIAHYGTPLTSDGSECFAFTLRSDSFSRGTCRSEVAKQKISLANHYNGHAERSTFRIQCEHCIYFASP